jgi:hypothetical protein
MLVALPGMYPAVRSGARPESPRTRKRRQHTTDGIADMPSPVDKV